MFHVLSGVGHKAPTAYSSSGASLPPLPPPPPLPPGVSPPPFWLPPFWFSEPEPPLVFSGSSTSPLSPEVTRYSTLPSSSRQVIWIEVFFSSSFTSTLGVNTMRRVVIKPVFTSSRFSTDFERTPKRSVPCPGRGTE